MEKIILFASMEYEKNKKITKVCVTDKKMEKKFVFMVNQKDYQNSLSELFNVLEKFCKEDCCCCDSRYCDIIFLRRDYKYDNPVEIFLGQVDWICVESIEFNYFNKLSHIKNPLSFNDFVKQVKGDENTPSFVAKVYDLYKKHIDKNSFTKSDIDNMVKYVKTAKLFEKPEKFYKQKITIKNLFLYFNFSVSEALVRLAIHDKTQFTNLIENICYQFSQSIKNNYNCVYIMKNMIEYILDGYTKKIDYKYWITEEAQNYLNNKYFSIFQECKCFELLKTVVKHKNLFDISNDK